jgi:hypothetical protein
MARVRTAPPGRARTLVPQDSLNPGDNSSSAGVVASGEARTDS